MNNELQPLGRNVLADLTVEELEARLEMQMISIPETDWCLVDATNCGFCNPVIQA